MKKGGLFGRLSGKKVDKTDNKLDAASIKLRYPTLNDLCAAVGENPSEGAKLLQLIMADITLFKRYTTTPDKLKTFVTMVPAKIDDIIQMIKSDPECEETFLTGVATLVDVNAFFKARKGLQYQDDLVKLSLSNHRVYSQLFISEHQLEEALRLLPQFQETILEILTNDITIFCKCVGRLPFFCEFCKKHEKYRARFVSLAYTSEPVFNKLYLSISREFDKFVEHFPEACDPLVEFICTDAKRFIDVFGTFDSIYEFCKKPNRANHLQRLFEQAISAEGYVKHHIASIDRLVEVYNYNPSHAERLETMVLADPKWVLAMIHYSEDIQTLYNHKAFGRLKSAYFELYYSNLINFRGFAGSDARLETVISYAPDQEFRLRLYYQLHIKEVPVAEIIKMKSHDAATLLELKVHIHNCIKQNTIAQETLSALRDQINGILDFTEDTAPNFAALTELKKFLDYNLSPNVASLLHKGTITEDATLKEKRDSAQTAAPNSPNRLSNN